MVFYRKYRPQTIAELDLVLVREKLTAVLARNIPSFDKKAQDVPHAFLFSGPKGLGKTSAARIVAKAINCIEKSKIKDQISKTQIKNKQSISSNKKEEIKKVSDFNIRISDFGNIEPCNQCEACISITNGSNLDVLEIDAASNRGIDEIRDLREKIKFAPVSLPKKVYIIDEVHMLTTEAFNALLKTLEEPPSHALFILCTTEPWKLPETIVSRTFLVPFEKPTKEELVRSLDRVIKGEQLVIQEDVLEAIFKLSNGAFRDATKIIEELSIVSVDKKITRELLEKTFQTGTIDQEVLILLECMAKKDAKESLLAIDRLAKNGVDFALVIEKLTDYARRLFLKRAGLPEKINDIEGLDTISLQTLAEYFSAAYKELKFAVIPQLPLELVVVKWCVIDQIDQTENVKQKTQNKDTVARKSDLKKENKDVKRSDLIKKQSFASDDFLKQLIDKVKKDNHSIAGVLRGCKLIKIENGEIKLETAYKFHLDKLNDKKTKSLIVKRAGEILGREVKLEIQMKG